MRVIVSHPARQHSYETAMAAHDAGALYRFITSFYWPGETSLDSMPWRLLPEVPRMKLGRQLARRRHPDLDPSLVARFPVFHGAARAFRLWQPLIRSERMLHVESWANAAFDRYVGQWLHRQPRPSIVHAFEGSAHHTLQAARQIGAAAVLDVPSAHEYTNRLTQEEGQRFDARWLATAAARLRGERRLAEWLFAPSEHVASCLREYGVPDKRIVQIPYGADPERFRPSEGRARLAERSGSTFRVLFVGRLAAWKGIRYLLEAWQQLALPASELVLAGTADEFGKRLLARSQSTYRCLGNVPYSRIHEAFEPSDVFVFPSLSEGSPLVVYEAMASGLPVVTTENAKAVVRDGIDGFIVPIRDPQAIAERIRWLFEHPDERRAMGASGRRRILDGFTWHHYRQRVACAYQAIQVGMEPRAALEELEASWGGWARSWVGSRRPA